ncbi:MAG: RNA polymerase sigma factor [Spirochaetaceae bacterium]|jgi:RNA polymerase sigma factor (sigma-70 family)|nr:RNA polymerase sigma factor [Spirochaetaceae bacterium]
MDNESKEEIFRGVYNDNINLLVKIIRRITGDDASAEDVCQDSMMRYYQRIGSVPEGIEARYWLIRVAKNLAFNYAKKKERERKAYQKFLNDPSIGNKAPEDTKVLAVETKEIVQRALDKLPEKLKTVIVLKEYSDMNYKEIGKSLKISESNVKVRVFRARKRLAELIREDEIYVP